MFKIKIMVFVFFITTWAQAQQVIKNAVLYPETHGSLACDAQVKKLLSQAGPKNYLFAKEGIDNNASENFVSLETPYPAHEISIIANYIAFKRNKDKPTKHHIAVHNMGMAAYVLQDIQQHALNMQVNTSVAYANGQVDQDAQTMYTMFSSVYQNYQRGQQLDFEDYKDIFEKVVVKVVLFLEQKYSVIDRLWSEYGNSFDEPHLKTFLEPYGSDIYQGLLDEVHSKGLKEWYGKFVILLRNKTWIDQIDKVFFNEKIGVPSIYIQVGLHHIDTLSAMLAARGYQVEYRPMCY